MSLIFRIISDILDRAMLVVHVFGLAILNFLVDLDANLRLLSRDLMTVSKAALL